MRPGPFLCLLIGAGLAWYIANLYPLPKGELAPDEPQQTTLANGEVPPWDYLGYHFTPLARYQVRARILDKSRYWIDRSADISPLDLALGWGQMSDPAVYGKMFIFQSFRWYWYFYSGTPPIPDSDIATNSANTHIIPATPAVKDVVLGARAGDVIELAGYLVAVTGPNDFKWQSSLSRTDTGDGACEVMWVESAATAGR